MRLFFFFCGKVLAVQEKAVPLQLGKSYTASSLPIPQALTGARVTRLSRRAVAHLPFFRAHTSTTRRGWGEKKNGSAHVVRNRSLWAVRDSNPRPSACKADALNQLR